jgi:hypothetical protein
MKNTEISLNWKNWIMNCTVGELLGIGIPSVVIGIAGVLLGGTPMPLRQAQVLMLLAMLAAGAAEGLCIGFFQWRVLKYRFHFLRPQAWIGVTMSMVALNWFLGALPSVFVWAATPNTVTTGSPSLATISLFVLMSGIVFGSLVGVAQWWVLRKHATHAGRWILANALAWTAVLVWIYAGALAPRLSSVEWMVPVAGAVSGILSGVTFGAITWSFLKHMHPVEGILSQDKVA